MRNIGLIRNNWGRKSLVLDLYLLSLCGIKTAEEYKKTLKYFLTISESVVVYTYDDTKKGDPQG